MSSTVSPSRSLKLEYRLELQSRRPAVTMSLAALLRHPVIGDAEALSQLLLDAYRDTVDDEGEGPVEARQFAADVLNAAWLDTSWLAVSPEGTILSAVLIQRWRGAALVTFVATASLHKGRRLAQLLVERSIESLTFLGERTLVAFVTEGNVASERLLARLGFRLS